VYSKALQLRRLLLFPRKAFRLALGKVQFEKPIFVVGLQGGGLTLIHRILSRAPNANFVFAGGNYRSWWATDEMQNVWADRLPEELRLGRCRFHGPDARFGNGAWMYGVQPYFDHFRKTEADATPELGAAFIEVINEIVALNAVRADACRFIDKSQSYGLKIGFISRILEEYDPRFLIVTRNPYIACCRAVQQPSICHLDISPEAKLETAIEHYGNCMRTMLADARTRDNVCLIRLEDFLQDPPATIRKACAGLDIDYADSMLPQKNDRYPRLDNKWYPLRTNVNTRYVKGISRKQIEVIRAKCGDIAEELAYEPP